MANMGSVNPGVMISLALYPVADIQASDFSYIRFFQEFNEQIPFMWNALYSILFIAIPLTKYGVGTDWRNRVFLMEICYFVPTF